MQLDTAPVQLVDGSSTVAPKQAYAAIVAERDALKWELDLTKQSLAEAREVLRELKAAVLARQKAEAALADLYRERAIARAQAAERDPDMPLQ